MAARSEHLADHDSRYGGEDRDSESGDGVLSLGHGHGGDHAGSQAGHAQLGGEIVAAVQGLLSTGRTVESGFGWGFRKGRLRYAASGFVTCRNGSGSCAAFCGPLLEGLQLFACRA